MRVCIDTNVLVQLFGTSQPFGRIADAIDNHAQVITLLARALHEDRG